MKLTKRQKNIIINALNHYKEHLEECENELTLYGKETLDICKDTIRAIDDKVIL